MKTFAVQFRRKRQQKTNYRKRARMLVSARKRIVVRRTANGMLIQLIEFGQTGDKIIASQRSHDLKKLGWLHGTKNLSACYLAGYAIGKKIGNIDAIADIGDAASIGGSRIYATLMGIKDSGVQIPLDDSVLPPMDRISGKHIAKYASQIKDSNQFKHLIKQGAQPSKITQDFEMVLGKLK